MDPEVTTPLVLCRVDPEVTKPLALSREPGGDCALPLVPRLL